MSKGNKYFFISVPSSITPSGHQDDAIQSLQQAANESYATVQKLKIPNFKVSTLDTLLQQSEELAKLAGMCQGVVAKVADCLSNVVDGDEARLAQHKSVNDKPLDQYLKTFTWNKVKYSFDKPLAELMDLLQKEAQSIDSDVRSKYSQYQSTRTNLQTLTRKQTGNLSTKSLVSIVKPSLLVPSDSEYLQTHLVAIPNNNVKEFIKGYETYSPMVVPRSATFIEKDDEFSLYAVTTFKKTGADFEHKLRDRKYVPRDFKYKEGGKEEEEKEVDRVAVEERKLLGETLRMSRTGWSEGVMVWIHVLVLRVFVETVLRYGLPLDYVSALVRTTSKQAKKAKSGLDTSFAYLAGNAFGKDKKGRPKKDDSSVGADMAATGQQEGDYSAYVCYEFECD